MTPEYDGKRCVPVYLTEDEYTSLVEIARAEDRLPIQQAHRIMRLALGGHDEVMIVSIQDYEELQRLREQDARREQVQIAADVDVLVLDVQDYAGYQAELQALRERYMRRDQGE